MAKQLDIPCYDSELITKIAEESGFDKDYVKDTGENCSGGFLSLVSGIAFGPNNEDYIWQMQCKIISDLAEEGPCVIVGRCADYVLRDKADCLKVFIHADNAFRADRIVRVYGESDISVEQRIKEKDKRRAAYHRFYTDMKWGHSQNYDITLNSGTLGIDNCVKIIIQLLILVRHACRYRNSLNTVPRRKISAEGLILQCRNREQVHFAYGWHMFLIISKNKAKLLNLKHKMRRFEVSCYISALSFA